MVFETRFFIDVERSKIFQRKCSVFGNKSRHRIDQCFTNFLQASLARNDLVRPLIINFGNFEIFPKPSIDNENIQIWNI